LEPETKEGTSSLILFWQILASYLDCHWNNYSPGCHQEGIDFKRMGKKKKIPNFFCKAGLQVGSKC
jgi:hypothetical protein